VFPVAGEGGKKKGKMPEEGKKPAAKKPGNTSSLAMNAREGGRGDFSSFSPRRRWGGEGQTKRLKNEINTRGKCPYWERREEKESDKQLNFAGLEERRRKTPCCVEEIETTL